MVAKTPNEKKEKGQMSFVLKASETRKMVRSLTGVWTLLVGVSGRQDAFF